MGFIEEIREEAEDFFDDFFELLAKRRTRAKKPAVEPLALRPAYFFAQRVDNVLRIIFGVSILISAATATFLGFSTIGDLLHTLINSWWGRSLMGLIGFSYLMTAVWRLIHLKREV